MICWEIFFVFMFFSCYRTFLLWWYNRVRSRSCSASATKACREKMRRDRLNDRHALIFVTIHSLSLSLVCWLCVISRFLELGSVLDPGRPPKMDKVVLLSDAVRMVIQLRDEAQKLKDANESLLEKMSELKVTIHLKLSCIRHNICVDITAWFGDGIRLCRCTTWNLIVLSAYIVIGLH